MSARAFHRGHVIVWDDSARIYRYEDTGEPWPGAGGANRPCRKCGKTFEGSIAGDPDPCLGVLPGVDNACCGHGVPSEAYIRFRNGVVIRGFSAVSYTNAWKGCAW